MSRYFILGWVPDERQQHSLNQEAKIYQDIIQANFRDTYQNLTLKYLSVLAYVYFSCSAPDATPNKKFADGLFKRQPYNPPTHLLKADDDMFLNVDMALLLASANPAH